MPDLRIPEINRVCIAGSLGHAPELRHSSDGTPVCEFSVAIAKRWKQKDGTTGQRASIITSQREARCNGS